LTLAGSKPPRSQLGADRRLARRDIALGAASLVVLSACRRGSRLPSFTYDLDVDDRKALEALVGRFRAEQPGTKIEGIAARLRREPVDRVRASLEAGSAPALTHVPAEALPFLAEAGLLEPLDRYGDLSDIPPLPGFGQRDVFALEESRPIFGVPFDPAIPLMFVNRERLTRAGVGVPSTLGELRGAASLTTERRGDATTTWGLACPVTWSLWGSLLAARGGRMVDAQGKLDLGGDTGVAVLSMWHDMVHEDRSMRAPTESSHEATRVALEDFAASRANILLASSAHLGEIEARTRFDLDVSPMPPHGGNQVLRVGTFLAIPRAAPSDAKATAFALLRWLAAPSQAAEWARSTGGLPATRGAFQLLVESGYLTPQRRLGNILGNTGSAMRWPWDPALFRLEREIMDPLLRDAVVKKRDARAALAEALKRARAT
jgi:sn-glycerol 3-phosphate transport system substrate-binding protein